jgi:hypothetical protein
VVDVPGVTGSAFFGAGPIAREPDPEGGDVDGGGVVVWAKEAPEISVTKPVTMMKGLSIERTPSHELRFIVFNPVRGRRVPADRSVRLGRFRIFFEERSEQKKEGRLVAPGAHCPR